MYFRSQLAKSENALSVQLFRKFSLTHYLLQAAELSHRSMIINLQQISLPLFGPVQAKERFLLPLCISHIFGAVSAYYALINGATVYMLSKVYPKVVIEALSNYNVSYQRVFLQNFVNLYKFDIY